MPALGPSLAAGAFEDVIHLVLSHLVLSRGSFESKVCNEEPGINSS